MAISLTDVNGNPISLMGSGSTQWSSGAATNAAQFGQPSLFGGLASSGASAITPATTSTTAAGSTSKMGYTDLTKGHGIRGGRLRPGGAGVKVRQLNTTEDFDTQGPAGPLLKTAYDKLTSPDEEPTGRNASMRYGMAEATPGGLSGDVADLAEDA